MEYVRWGQVKNKSALVDQNSKSRRSTYVYLPQARVLAPILAGLGPLARPVLAPEHSDESGP